MDQFAARKRQTLCEQGRFGRMEGKMNKIAHLALNDEGFVFDPTTGDSFMANGTGLFILKKLRENLLPVAIVQALTEEYEVTLEDAERDVNDFCGQLKALAVS